MAAPADGAVLRRQRWAEREGGSLPRHGYSTHAERDGGGSLPRHGHAERDGGGSLPRHGHMRGAVSFQEPELSQDSLDQSQLLEGGFPGSPPADVDATETPGRCIRWRSLILTPVENKHFRRFFRACAVVNILSLICSAPFTEVSPASYTLTDRFWQYVVIVVVDAALCVVYTLQTIARVLYTFYPHRYHHPEQYDVQYHVYTNDEEEEDEKGREFPNPVKLLFLVLITVSMYGSVAIGISRSVKVWEIRNNTSEFPSVLPWAVYIVFIPRSLAMFSAMKLLVPLKLPYSNLIGIVKSIKWKQLVYVTFFYAFFVYMYALVAVQWIGGLSGRYYHDNNNGQPELAIPTTHCLANASSNCSCGCSGQRLLGADTGGFTCMYDHPNGSHPLNINFRNTLYYGQFRFLPDALFAVYEASSLELWSFMEYTAFDGSPRMFTASLFYYGTLVFFLVIFVQQSIFLVVIIESFAGLRSDTALVSRQKTKERPLNLLQYDQPGSAKRTLIIQAQAVAAAKVAQFSQQMQRYYVERVEKFFLILVLADALITSLKYTGMPPRLAEILLYWQISVSVLFLLEILAVLAVHVYQSLHLGKQPLLLFLKKKYYWFLAVLAVGGVVAAIPLKSSPFYWPLEPYNGLAIFQALRLLRTLRLVPRLRKFTQQITGDGTQLVVVTLITLFFLIWFAVINMQLFGYLSPKENCDDISNHFDNFLSALESMFQLVMQEGWSELMSEIMCNRPEWWPINLLFIMLHLFGSLILLNFFVAVILDNLDYDDDEKVVKLEQELKTRKKKKVPPHLKLVAIFGGPKRVAAPKLSSAQGVDVPNLTEAEVRSFYKSGEASQFPTVPFPSDHTHFTHDTKLQRQSSELSHLGLLTSDSCEVISSEIPAHHGKYWGVQGILSYVKAFRQMSREQASSGRGQDALGGGRGSYDFKTASGQLDTSPLVDSEYDEYRQNYRLFDSALCCLHPEHRLRRFCMAVLTKRMPVPVRTQTSIHSLWQFLQAIGNWFSYKVRAVLSWFPYLTWLMLVVTITGIAVQAVELGLQDKRIDHPRYFWPMDLIIVLFTLTELLLKILAHGLLFNPNAALHSLWDVLDWITTLASFVVMVIFLSCSTDASQDFTFHRLPPWFRFLLLLRALRPLRILSLSPGMRRVIWDVSRGWKKFVTGVILLVSFMFFFASLGVQLFAGGDSIGPQGFCNDPAMVEFHECTGDFFINVRASREALPTSRGPQFLVPRVWYSNRRDFPFDNTAQALLTLFDVLTLEGWLDARDMLQRPDSSVSGHYYYMQFYLYLFIFFGVNILLQLFVGIVVNNFNEHKPDHSALLTVSQKRWTDLIQRLSLTRPIKRPPEPSGCLRYVYRVFMHRQYRNFISGFILANSLTLITPWVVDPEKLHTATKIEIGFSLFFATFFIIEMILKVLTFGAPKYFQSWRNVFDFFLGLLAAAHIVCASVHLRYHDLICLDVVADIALYLAIFKCCTILGKYSTFQNLTITVAQTAIKSASLIAVLLVTLLFYAFSANIYFSNVRTGEAIDYNHVNFAGMVTATNAVVRVMTGEDWHHLLYDTMVDEPYCSQAEGTCGNDGFAVVWFISFYFLVTFIFLNIFIAVLLENFSIFYNEDDTNLSHSVVRDFRHNWLHFDKDASGYLPANDVKLFLRMLRVTELYTYQVDSGSGLRERRKSSVLEHPLLLREVAEELHKDPRLGGQPDPRPGGQPDPAGPATHEGEGEGRREEKHSFQSVLKTLAHRAETIERRLVPQELYEREEFEEGVQFDVAEMCILKWMDRFVGPVLRTRRRKPTIAVSKRPLPREDTLWAPSISVDQLDEGWGSQQSCDTEDEEPGSQPASKPRLPSSPEEPDDSVTPQGGGDLARSYARLAKMAGPTPPRDRWHDWFRLQGEWLSHIEEDPDNYFDDLL